MSHPDPSYDYENSYPEDPIRSIERDMQTADLHALQDRLIEYGS